MDDPDARVVSLESNGNVARRGEQDDVPARRVIVAKGAVKDILGVEVAVLLGEEDKVVTVQVDRMGHGYEGAVFHGGCAGAVAGGNYKVDPIIFAVVFRDQGLIDRGEVGDAVVLDVIDGWIAKIQPHG